MHAEKDIQLAIGSYIHSRSAYLVKIYSVCSKVDSAFFTGNKKE